MGLACIIFGHKWNGCKCMRCGKLRNEQHDWSGCVCSICGRERNEQHDWDLCKGICKRCRKIQREQHDWNGCKCMRCGKLRNEQHDWNGCVCSICGRVRDEQHVFSNCKCSKCKKIRHSWLNEKCTQCGITIIEDSTSKRHLSDADKHEIIEAIINQSTYYDLITATGDSGGWYQEIREMIRKQIRDDAVLQKIALDQKLAHTYRVIAVRQITDQALMEETLKTMPGMNASEQSAYDMDIRSGM